MVMVEKKSRAKHRHQVVANAFQIWLEKHPSATPAEKLKALDHLSDSAYLSDQIEKRAS